MKRFSLVLAAMICLLAAPCFGSLADAIDEAPPRIAQWQESVCRIEGYDNTSISRGSGVYIGRGLVLTANHVVQETYASHGKFIVDFPGGLRGEAILSGRSFRFDCAFLRITNSDLVGTLRPVLFASADPNVGDVVWRCGYGKTGILKWSKGIVLGFSGPESAPPLPDISTWFSSTGGASNGDSGGPTFDDYGRLIGNLWGSVDGETYACLATTVTRAMTEPIRKELVQFHTQCYGPNCYRTQPYMRPKWRPSKLQQCPPAGRVVVERPKPKPPKKPLVPVVQPNDRYDELKEQLDRLEAMIAQCKGTTGPPGKPGASIRGEQGPPGPTPDIEELTRRIRERLTFYVEVLPSENPK